MEENIYFLASSQGSYTYVMKYYRQLMNGVVILKRA